MPPSVFMQQARKTFAVGGNARASVLSSRRNIRLTIWSSCGTILLSSQVGDDEDDGEFDWDIHVRQSCD